MKILHSFFLALKIIPLLIFGWLKLIFRFFLEIFKFISQKKMLFILFFFTSIFQFISATRPWIEYTVDFVDAPEIVNVSIKSNIYFLIFSLINFFIINFKLNKITINIYLLIQSLALILYFSGLVFPSIFFVDFLKETDYRYHPVAIIFGSLCGLNLLLGFLTKNSTSTVNEQGPVVIEK